MLADLIVNHSSTEPRVLIFEMAEKPIPVSQFINLYHYSFGPMEIV